MRSKRSIATQVWQLMSDYSRSQFHQKTRSLHDLGLTPGHMKALLTLEPGDARPIGSCAQEMGCDASTATWLIDRLEERGLVERRPSRSDRRVKGVLLTQLGAETKASLQEHYYEPPAELLDLDRESLESLLDALSKLAQCGPSFEHHGSERKHAASP
jgi:DNA-binding MarR family transcriptional regulator